MTGAERRVWAVLSSDEPAHIDALAEASGLAASGLAAALPGFELRELVGPLPGKCFVREM